MFCHKHPKKRLTLDCKSPLGVRRGLKMIVSQRAPSSLNMSSYRAIWTHFRPNFILLGQKISDCQKSKLFLKCKSPHLAILINIWHIWEDRSRKVNNDEPDLRFFHGNFWPVISQAVRKPCFSTSIPRGPTHLGPAWAHPDAAAGAGRILKSRSRPLPTHPGMKYFRKETLAVDVLCRIICVEKSGIAKNTRHEITHAIDQ